MGRARHVIWLFLVIVINNEPILSSMLAAGIVQDTFAGEAGEAGEGERGRQNGDDWRLILPPRPEILPSFVAIEFLSQITNTRKHIRNVHTYGRRHKKVPVPYCATTVICYAQ